MGTQGFAERISQIKDIGRDLQDDDVMGIGQEDSNKEIIPVNVPFGDLKQEVVNGIIKNPDMKDAFYATEAIIHDKVNDTVDINPKWTDEFMVRRDSLEISYVGDLNADFLPFSFDFKITTGTLTMFEDMPVLLDGQYYIVKKSSFPVHNMVMNSRRYLYLELRNGVPVIFISTQVLPETYIRTCFGFYYFSNDADPWVSEHQAFSYSRIGTYRVSPDPRGTSVPATYDSPARPAECWWLTKLYGPCAVNELETTLLIDKDFGGSRGELKEGYYLKGPYDLYKEYVRIKGRDPLPEEEITFIVDKDVAVIGKPGFWSTTDKKSPIRDYPTKSVKWSKDGSPLRYYPSYGYCDNNIQYDRNMRVLSYKLNRWADNISANRQFRYKEQVLGFVYGQVALTGFFIWVWWLKVVVRILDPAGKVISTHNVVDTNTWTGWVLNNIFDIPYGGGIELEVNYNSGDPEANNTTGGVGIDIIAYNANPNPAIVIPKTFTRAKTFNLLVNGLVLGCGGDGGEYYVTSRGRGNWRKDSSSSGDIGILNHSGNTTIELGPYPAAVYGGGSSCSNGVAWHNLRPAGATGSEGVALPVAGGAPFGRGGIATNNSGIPMMVARDAGLLKGGANTLYRSNYGGQGGNAGLQASAFIGQEPQQDQWGNPTNTKLVSPSMCSSLPGYPIYSTQAYKLVNRKYLSSDFHNYDANPNVLGLYEIQEGGWSEWNLKKHITNQYSTAGTFKPGSECTLRLSHTWKWLEDGGNNSLTVTIPTSPTNPNANPAKFIRTDNITNASSPGLFIVFSINANAKVGDDIEIRVTSATYMDIGVWETYRFKVK